MSRVRKNFIYSMFYQILSIIIPLITVPYVSKIIGAEGIGIYSYTYTYAYYFMLFGMLGINNYGSRKVAGVRDDKEKLSNTFYSIYYLQIFISIISLILYFVLIAFIERKYFIVSLIQGLYVFSSCFDINWLYNGLENFKITVSRNSIIKILSLILIILFVKKSDDVIIYALILASSTFISNLLLMMFLKKYVAFKKVKIKDILKALKPCLILFIPIIAMKIYKEMDKTMLGLFANIKEVGYYTNADGIINIPMGVIIALGNVMLPNLSNLISKKKIEDAKRIFFKSFKFALFMAIPIFFGTIAIGKDFIDLYLGKGFAKSGDILIILSITVVFMTISNVIRTQYFIPNKKDKQYIIAIVFGAIINLISNLIFIPKYGSWGACIGTVLAEFVVMIIHVSLANKDLPIFQFLINNTRFFITGVIMLAMCYFVREIPVGLVFSIILRVLIGTFSYLLLNYNYVKEILKTKKIG